MRMMFLSLVVILGSATPASAQRPAHDPFALTIPDISYIFLTGKYCVSGSARGCTFDDVESCVKAARKLRVERSIPDASCKPNMLYQPGFTPTHSTRP
jgi:hypothetical protein